MTRQNIRIVLASGVMIAVGLVGVAAAKGNVTTKTSDRLSITQDADAPLERVAALDPAAPPGPPARGRMAGRFDGAGGPPPFDGPPPHPRHGPMAGPSGPGMGPHGGPPHRDPMAYARTLAAAETALGIRSDQLDAWRGFTDALLAAAPPPPPPPGRGPNLGAKDAAGTPPDPMTGVERLASRLQEQGKAGARLAEAAQTLKAKLSADQLERMARLGPALMPPPPGLPFPPPPFGGPPPGLEDAGPGRPPVP